MKKSYLHRWSSSRSTSGYRVWIAHPSRLGLTRGIPRLRMEGCRSRRSKSPNASNRQPQLLVLRHRLSRRRYRLYSVLHHGDQELPQDAQKVS